MRSLVSPVILIAGLVAAVPSRGFAQEPRSAGPLSVTVRDSLGRSVAGAELSIAGSNARGVRDARGEVTFSLPRGGPVTLNARRLGFRPATVEVMVDAHAPSTSVVTLMPIPQRLAPVVVRAAEYTGRMAGFYQRRDQGIGSFVTREKLEAEQPARLTDLIRQLPGVKIRSTPGVRNAVRFRLADVRCWPLVWLDGLPLAGGEYDLDLLPPNSIEGIEVYSGMSRIPSQFLDSRVRGTCGAIVVWSREGQARPKKPKTAVTATQLAELVASLKVYTADQVDVPARGDSLSLPRPIYPDAMLATGLPGHVLVEFVVDTLGSVELDTFGVISSTNAPFTAAVQRVLTEWQYVPAMLSGKRVRQLVQQAFSFVVDSSVVRRGSRP